MFHTTIIIFLFTFLSTTFHLPALPVLPDPDPVSIPTQSLHLPPPSPLPTIPAFPEQSEASTCPLDLPDDLFHGIKTACGSKPHRLPDPDSYSGRIHRARCCPVLAAYLYSAYSRTALRTIAKTREPVQQPHSTAPHTVDMPVLPDDSETCVDSLEKELENKGVQLSKHNETCDVIYCYCGIRLRAFACPQAFSVSSKGEVIGNAAVRKLEENCGNGGSGNKGCSDCLNALRLLSTDDNELDQTNRSSRMRSRDCEMMGLTWLLNKDRSRYIRTVSDVLRVIMMSKDDEVPEFCSVGSDGLPLAVDSSEISAQSSSTALAITLQLQYLLPLTFILFLFAY